MVKKGGATRTIYYVGSHFEKEIGATTEFRTHAMVNGQRFYTQLENSGDWVAYYNLRDHLGSVDKQALTVGSGTDPLQYSFDAFGKRRNTNWTPDNNDALQTATLWNHRGYTDHEQLDNVRLIHMNGRVYDPKLGRFISADPVLGDLSSPQSLNPYSYVTNNSLAYTDPSGFEDRPTTRWCEKGICADSELSPWFFEDVRDYFETFDERWGLKRNWLDWGGIASGSPLDRDSIPPNSAGPAGPMPEVSSSPESTNKKSSRAARSADQLRDQGLEGGLVAR